MSAWKSVELFASRGEYVMPGSLPKVAACYAIYVDGRLVYIGQAPWGSGSRIVVKYRQSRKYGDWAMVELRLIRRLSPSGNRVHVRRAS
jgi:hypothetical protein